MVSFRRDETLVFKGLAVSRYDQRGLFFFDFYITIPVCQEY